jgi:hypothetical protein
MAVLLISLKLRVAGAVVGSGISQSARRQAPTTTTGGAEGHRTGGFVGVTKAGPDNPKWRLYAGWTLVVLGCAAPLFIPLILTAPLSVAAKAGLSALMAFGLPEVLILSAFPLLGKERINALFAQIKAFFIRAR